MQEFVYCDVLNLGIPLEDSIVQISEKKSSEYEALISNTKEVKSECYAPEIDFYLAHSEDNILEKAKSTSILYEARAIGFDYAKAMDFSQEVGNNIMLVGDINGQNEALTKELKSKGKAVLALEEKEIVSISGHLGDLHVVLKQDGENMEVDASFIVWAKAPFFATKQSGVINVTKENIEEIIATIEAKSGLYEYKNFIFYESSICQYHERRDEICGKCAEVCPTVAIVKEDEKKHLKFSHIDCLGCGGCISVCPSGALDYSLMPVHAFYEIAKLYKDKIPLIVPRKMFEKNLHTKLPKEVLPFGVEGEKFMHEAHLLTLLQQSGSQVIFYTDFISKGTGDVISILNQAYQAKYKKDAILVCKDIKELQESFKKATFIENSYYDFDEPHLIKREVFAKRLHFLVGQSLELGTIKSGEHVRYGNVLVNENACTLCLSCVDACNVGALVADAKDNSLKFNASICTTCGYCETTCPEKDCLEVVRGEISLEPQWFEKKVLAKDTLFACINCGKEFGTTKSVMKIAEMMKPVFKDDEIKIKSLYCCADCKPKLMFQSYLDQKQ